MDEIINFEQLWQEMQAVWEQPLTLNVYITVRQRCGHKKFLRWSSAPSLVDCIKFHADNICYDCWMTFKRNENISINYILGLPKLCGSRKQYISGSNIRAEFAIILIDKGSDELIIKSFLQEPIEAGWWIDNKQKLLFLFDIHEATKASKLEKDQLKVWKWPSAKPIACKCKMIGSYVRQNLVYNVMRLLYNKYNKLTTRRFNDIKNTTSRKN